jgi:hypothetical protein
MAATRLVVDRLEGSGSALAPTLQTGLQEQRSGARERAK